MKAMEELLRPLAYQGGKCVPRALMMGIKLASEGLFVELAPKLKKCMQESGDALIGFQRNKGMPNFFRLVLAGAKGVTEQVLVELLGRMDQMGQIL